MTLTPAPVLSRHSDDGRPWWRVPFRVFQTNLREPDATLDVERTLDAIERHGSNVWLINGGGIVSFYPTDLPFQVRNPYLEQRSSGDLLGDAIEAAHRRGIRVIARMDFSKVPEQVAHAHPEWLYVDPAGDFQVYQGLYSTCPSADYYQKHAFDVLTEVADRYPVDGFFFNWFGFNEIDYSGRYRGVSQNTRSAQAFAEWSGGRRLPTDRESPDYLEWSRFAAETIRDLTSRFREHISDVAPGAAFIRGPGADVVFHEANNAIGRANWPFATSEAVSAIRSAAADQPVFVNSVAFVDMPYRLAAEETDRYEQYIAQTLSRGGNPSVYIMGAPGDIDYPNVADVSPLFHFHRDNAGVYTDVVSAADVAVVRPTRLHLGDSAYASAENEFRGVYRSLQQRHVPFDVLPYNGTDLLPERGAYRVIVLPDCGDIDDESVAALDEAVDDGTIVLLTGSSMVRSKTLTYSPVERYSSELSGDDVYATYAAQSFEEEVHPRHPVVPIFGSYYPIVLRDGSDASMSVVLPAAYGPPEKAYGNVVSREPAVGIRRAPSGGGVIVIPWTIGRAFHELGLTVFRDLIVDAVRVGMHESIEFELPPHVEVTLQRGPSDLVIHLVNLSGVQGNGFVEPIPVRGGAMRVPYRARAIDVTTGRELPAEGHGGGSRIPLPDIGALAVVRLSPITNARPTEETT